MDHAAAIDRGGRVVRAVPPPEVARLEIGALDRVVAPAAGEPGRDALGRLRVEEDVGLVRTAVDGGAAQFGEPDRL